MMLLFCRLYTDNKSDGNITQMVAQNAEFNFEHLNTGIYANINIAIADIDNQNLIVLAYERTGCK